MIPYGRRHIDDADIDAMIEALKSDWLTQGPRLRVHCLAMLVRNLVLQSIALLQHYTLHVLH